MILTAVKDGTIKLLERIQYSNGKEVERELDPKTRVPVSITIIKDGK